MADLLDRNVWPPKAKDQKKTGRKGTILGFVEQAQAASTAAGTPYWVAIHRRDHREDLIYVPKRLMELLCDDDWPDRHAIVCNPEILPSPIVVCRLDDFFDKASPKQVRRLAKGQR